jgi:hypothetical protein
VFDQGKRNPHPLSSLWRVAPKANSAKPAKALSLAARNPWRQASEITVKANEYRSMHFADGGYHGIGRILCDPFTQQDHFVPSSPKLSTHGIGNAMIDEKFYRRPLSH